MYKKEMYKKEILISWEISRWHHMKVNINGAEIVDSI